MTRNSHFKAKQVSSFVKIGRELLFNLAARKARVVAVDGIEWSCSCMRKLAENGWKVLTTIFNITKSQTEVNTIQGKDRGNVGSGSKLLLFLTNFKWKYRCHYTMCVHEDGASDLEAALRNRCTETIVTETIISGCLTIAGFASGLIMCLAIYRNPRLQHTIHMYILSYAIIDLIKSSFVMPFTFAVLIKGEWISSTSMCQFQGYFISIIGFVTIVTMTMTALDRYVANTHLAQYLTSFKRKYVCGALAVSWLISFAVPLSFTITGNHLFFTLVTASAEKK